DYLIYAYLQGGQDREAKRALDAPPPGRPDDPQYMNWLYAMGASPARYAVERHRWAEAAALLIPPNTFPGGRAAWTEANLHFARALGASHTGQIDVAEKEVHQLASLRDTLTQVNDSYWADQLDIQRQTAAAWITLAEGKREEALRQMRSAAEHEDSTDKNNVTPGVILPARELLGEMLLELKQPAQAMVEFEATLRTAPNRFNALSGAARAAKLSGDNEKAKTYYARLLAICQHADGDRPELQDARSLLAEKRAGARVAAGEQTGKPRRGLGQSYGSIVGYSSLGLLPACPSSDRSANLRPIRLSRAKIPPFISPRVRTWLFEFPTLRKSTRVGFSRQSILQSRLLRAEALAVDVVTSQLLVNELANTFWHTWHRPLVRWHCDRCVGFVPARARAWSGQECVNFTFGIHPEAGDLSRIVDRGGIEQIPAGVCRNQRVQVGHHVVLPVEGAQVTRAVDPEAGDFTFIVERVATRGDGQNGTGQSADVLHAGRLRPQEAVNGSVRKQRRSTHLS